MGKIPVSASWQKRFSDHFAACPPLKKARVQNIFSSSQLNCSGARRKYSVQELRKARLKLCSPEKSGGKGSFGLAHCLDGTSGTRGEGLTGGEGVGARGKMMVGVGAELVISWVSCCSWAVRPTRIVLMVCSETFCCSMSSWR